MAEYVISRTTLYAFQPMQKAKRNTSRRAPPQDTPPFFHVQTSAELTYTQDRSFLRISVVKV